MPSNFPEASPKPAALATDIVCCRICSSQTAPFDEACVLGKYAVKYFRCTSCGFIQTEKPYWLDEAYSSAIASIDIGPLSRSISFAHITRCLILFALDPKGRFLDFGAGWGLFVRRMRDLGFDFRFHDQHCENLFAKGHEISPHPPNSFELVTAFEVMEHLVDPMQQILRLREVSESILFSTLVLPDRPPKICEWWYYTPEHGQHISFFSRRSLHIMANQLGLKLYSIGSVHFLTTRRLNRRLFALAVKQNLAAPIGHVLSRVRGIESLLESDFESISGKRIK